ncbi:MAG: S24 family peptidase [Armatimonadetes bacterium]|nr:S24 family peptidase [Armatimonadota bacterium]
MRSRLLVMQNSTSKGEIHIGRNIDALQHQLSLTDEQLLGVLGLSYNRFWDMKRRDWAQKKTIAQVAAALTQLSGMSISPEQILTGRLGPEQLASRAVEQFIRMVSELEHEDAVPMGGVRLPRLHLGAVPAGPAATFEPGDPSQVVRADPGDFVVCADGDCMLPTIKDGDELVCVHAESAVDGEVVVASYADELGDWQSGIKRLRSNGGGVRLTCDNQSADALGRRLFPDIVPVELRVQGVVVGLWRPLR